jgi:hypothetical protein
VEELVPREVELEEEEADGGSSSSSSSGGCDSGGEGTEGKRQSTAVSGSEKGKEIHPDDKKRLEDSSESVGNKRTREDAWQELESKRRTVNGVSGVSG